MGKDERFHRTLASELLRGTAFADLASAQTRFDRWRDAYNRRRPHEALDGAVPLDRYRPSPRVWSDRIEPFDYPHGDALRMVQHNGSVKLAGRKLYIGRAFQGRQVALREAEPDGLYLVFFRHQLVAEIDIRSSER